ncbi:MAG: thermonuclease family protein [Solirubrobacteraceae bacterium]
MTWRRASAWIALFAALAAVGGGCADQLAGRHREDPSELAPGERPNATLTGEVVKITDGDTIKVRLDSGRTERVRYIGMDTPETKKPGTPVQCFGRAATAANTRLVERRRVRLQLDTETRDRYGRLLAYVYRQPDAAFVNAILVRDGFAVPLTIPPNVAHADEFARLARAARASGRGLWSACG